MEESSGQSRISTFLFDKLRGSDQQAIVAFLQAMEAGGDSTAVIAEFSHKHPQLKGVFRFLARTGQGIHNAIGASVRTQGISAHSTDLNLLEKLNELEGFEFKRLVKAGGMGLVYEAVELSLNRRVAIKIRSSAYGRGEFERFQFEQQTLAKLEQKNIVTIHAAGNLGDIQYFVMKFIDGVSLDDLVASACRSNAKRVCASLGEAVKQSAGERSTQSGLSTPVPGAADQFEATPEIDVQDNRISIGFPRSYYHSVADCMNQIATAVQFAHDAGVLHRDLKPSNVMVDTDEHVWIIDFGLAHAVTREGGRDSGLAESEDDVEVVGTPRYMAPEQFAGKATVASDVWGIGAIFYELLTHRSPFRGRTRTQIEPPRTLVPTTPRDLSAICQKCLDLDPNRRYKSVQAFADDVRRWVGRTPISARSTPVPERTAMWVARHPVWAAISTVAVAAVIALQCYGIWYQTRLNAAFKQVTEARNEEAWQRRAAETRANEVARYKRAIVQQTASRLMNIGKAERARDLLSGQDRQDPASNDWEHRFLQNQLNRAAMVYEWKDGFVSSIAVDEDSARVIIGDSLGIVRIIDRQDGNVIAAFPAHCQRITGSTFSPDGRHIVTVGDDGLIKRWSADGHLMTSVESHIQAVSSVSFHPDEPLVATVGKDGVIAITDAALGQRLRVLQLDRGQPTHVRFSPDGRRLSVGTEQGRIHIWNMKSNGEGSRLDVETSATLQPEAAPNLGVLALMFHSKGQLLASVHNDNRIRLWDVNRQQLLDEFDSPIRGKVTDLRFDPVTDRIVVAGDDASIAFLNPLRRPQEFIFGHGSPVTSLAFAHDETMVSASSDGEMRIWKRGERRTATDVRAHVLNVVDLAFFPDGNRVVTASYDHDAAIIDIRSGEVIHTLGQHEHELNSPRNGRPGTIRSIATIHGHQNGLTCCDCVRSATGNKTIVATGAMDQTVRLWSGDRGKELGILEHPALITSVCFDPQSGQRLATACWDENIRIWDMQTQTVQLKFQASDSAHLNQVAFSPDGTELATAHGDGQVRLWDSSSGRLLHTLEGHAESVQCVAFDGSGRRLATGGGDDRTIRLWQRTSNGEWQSAGKLIGHTGSINRVAFNPAGDRIVSASQSSGDNTVRVWDIEIGLETLIVDGRTVGKFSPDGNQLALVGPGWTGSVRVLDASSTFPPPIFTSIEPLVAELPATRDLRILGSYRVDNIRGRNDPFEASEGNEWLCVVLSLPNSRLMLNPSDFQKWRHQVRRAGGTPIENAQRLRILSKEQFSLIIPDSKSIPAQLISGRWPKVDFVDSTMSHTGSNNFQPEARQAIVLAWQITKGSPLNKLSVRFSNDDPVRPPVLTLRPPEQTLLPD